jgi:hypothetical protein
LPSKGGGGVSGEVGGEVAVDGRDGSKHVSSTNESVGGIVDLALHVGDAVADDAVPSYAVSSGRLALASAHQTVRGWKVGERGRKGETFCRLGSW